MKQASRTPNNQSTGKGSNTTFGQKFKQRGDRTPDNINTRNTKDSKLMPLTLDSTPSTRVRTSLTVTRGYSKNSNSNIRERDYSPLLGKTNLSRTASYDRTVKKNVVGSFWAQIKNIERQNNWNEQYCGKQAFPLANSRSVSAEKRDTSFGIWGSKVVQDNREKSPCFGGNKSAWGENDDQKSQVSQLDNQSQISVSQRQTTSTILNQKQQAKYTYSQIQMGIDESQVFDPFKSGVEKKFQNQQTANLSQQMQQAKMLNTPGKQQKQDPSLKYSQDKAQNKVNTKLKYFTSQITTIPGPNNTQIGTQMTNELQNQKRDNLIFKEKTFELKNKGFYGSYYGQSKYDAKFEPSESHKSYTKGLKDNIYKKTTWDGACRRKRDFHKDEKPFQL